MGSCQQWWKVPDWARRGLRLCIALLIFGAAGHGLLMPKGLDPEFYDEYRQSCGIAGITAIVVNAPLIGRLVQTSTERVLGTVAGGTLGFLAVHFSQRVLGDGEEADLVLVLLAAAVGGLSCYLVVALSLDMTPRFFAMTVFLVTTNQRIDPGGYGAFMVASLRTGGVVLGVLVMQVLSIIILPRSASVEAFRDIRRALKALSTLNDLVWSANDLTADPTTTTTTIPTAATIPLPASTTPPSHSTRRGCGWCGWFTRRGSAAVDLSPERQPLLGGTAGGGVGGGGVNGGYVGGGGGNAGGGGGGQYGSGNGVAGPPWAGHGGKPGGAAASPAVLKGALAITVAQPHEEGAAEKAAREREQACEKQLAAVYAALTSCEENLRLSAGELYLWHFWGHYIFLPGIPNLGRLYSSKDRFKGWWHLRAPLVMAVADSMRRCSRLLWNVQLSLADEVTPELKEAVEALYPAGLLPHLARACGSALRYLAEAFPGAREGVNMQPLHEMAEVLLVLQAASDEQHRRMVHHFTEGELGRQLLRRSSLRPSSVMPSPSFTSQRTDTRVLTKRLSSFGNQRLAAVLEGMPFTPDVNHHHRSDSTFRRPEGSARSSEGLLGLGGVQRQGRGGEAGAWAGTPQQLARILEASRGLGHSASSTTTSYGTPGSFAPAPAGSGKSLSFSTAPPSGNHTNGTAGAAPAPALTGNGSGGLEALIRARLSDGRLPPRAPTRAGAVVRAQGQGFITLPPLPPDGGSTPPPNGSSSTPLPDGSTSSSSNAASAAAGLAASVSAPAVVVPQPSGSNTGPDGGGGVAGAPGAVGQRWSSAPHAAGGVVGTLGVGQGLSTSDAAAHVQPTTGSVRGTGQAPIVAGRGPSSQQAPATMHASTASASVRTSSPAFHDAFEPNSMGTSAPTTLAPSSEPPSSEASSHSCIDPTTLSHDDESHFYDADDDDEPHPSQELGLYSGTGEASHAMMGHRGLTPDPGRVTIPDLRVASTTSQHMHSSFTTSAGHGPSTLLFAATQEGHIAQVRWASFEWLVDQLGDELEEMFTAIHALVASLPHPL